MTPIFVRAIYLLKGAKYQLIMARAINTKLKIEKLLSHKPKIANSELRFYDDISPIYEKLVTVNTLGQLSKWRRSFVEHLAPFENMKILDAAAGTGLTTREILNQTAETSKSNFSICLCDVSLGMMQVGLNKMKQRPDHQELVKFVEADIHDLPFKNDTFDLAVFTFGFRTGVNIEQVVKGLFRVVKPNGRVGVLDFCYSKQPTAVQRLYNLFLDHIYSKIAYILWKKPEVAYYIADNIRKSPSKDEVVQILEAAGFRQISTESYMGGVSYHFIGHKINKKE